MDEALQLAQVKGFSSQLMVAELKRRGDSSVVECLTTELLLAELASRRGPVGALAESAILQVRKSQDYNDNGVTLDDYFPFGQMSYAQMMHVKVMRLISLSRMQSAGQQPNFEGIVDTLKDIINYASFNVDWLKRKDDRKEE